jgi:LysM repeat protein
VYADEALFMEEGFGMVFRWRYVVFVVMLLTAGCFQQAGESLQPANSTIVPQDATSSNNNPEPTENNSDLAEPTSNLPATSTFPPITVISPRETTPTVDIATSTPLVDSTETSTPNSEIPITRQVITPLSPLMANVDAEATSEPDAEAVPETSGEATEEVASESSVTSSNTNTSSDCTYTVQPGDNLYRISIANNFSMDEMRAANPELVGDAPILQVGQVLNLPNCGDNAPTEAAPVVISTTSANETPVAGGGETYVVQRGDTLLGIANRFGTTVRELVEANSLANPDRLSVGQVLIIPASDG